MEAGEEAEALPESPFLEEGEEVVEGGEGLAFLLWLAGEQPVVGGEEVGARAQGWLPQQ